MTAPGVINHFSKALMIALIAAVISGVPLKDAAACACCDTYRVVGVEDWDVLNVRAGPSTRYHIVGELPPGSCGLDVIGRRGGWLKIRFDDIRGWVSGRYVEFR